MTTSDRFAGGAGEHAPPPGGEPIPQSSEAGQWLVAVVAAVLASLIAMVLHLGLAAIIITALVTFVVILVLTGILGYRSTSSLLASLPTRFPTPDVDKSQA